MRYGALAPSAAGASAINSRAPSRFALGASLAGRYGANTGRACCAEHTLFRAFLPPTKCSLVGGRDTATARHSLHWSLDAVAELGGGGGHIRCEHDPADDRGREERVHRGVQHSPVRCASEQKRGEQHGWGEQHRRRHGQRAAKLAACRLGNAQSARGPGLAHSGGGWALGRDAAVGGARAE
eukprot:scaffold132781_cov69-Phaeocystis_antarctica.AAC.2